MRTAISIIGIAIALATSPTSAKIVELDRLFAFTDTNECTEGHDFARLRDSLLVVTSDFRLKMGQPVVPRAFAGAVGKPRMKIVDGVHEAVLPLTGSWRGLRVTALTVYAVEECDLSGFMIDFAASKHALLAAANEAGFALPPTGVRETGDILAMTVSVDGNARSSSLSCCIG